MVPPLGHRPGCRRHRQIKVAGGSAPPRTPVLPDGADPQAGRRCRRDPLHTSLGVIYYLTTAEHRYTMTSYLQTWGRALTDRVRVLPYEALWTAKELPPGSYVFADIDRLSEAARREAKRVWEALQRAGDEFRVLNHPACTMCRLELLRALNERGVNRFAAHHAASGSAPERFPVFLRREDDHLGSVTPLLRTQDEFEAAVSRAASEGGGEVLLVIEFCDTADASGIFRKYSAFVVDGRIVPRHLIFSRDWQVKTPDLLDEDKLREERDFLEANPHEAPLREIAAMARVDYGRIDYALIDDDLQIWEINTNPVVLLPRQAYRPQHLPAQEWFAARILKGLEALDRGRGAGGLYAGRDRLARASPSRLELRM